MAALAARLLLELTQLSPQAAAPVSQLPALVAAAGAATSDPPAPASGAPTPSRAASLQQPRGGGGGAAAARTGGADGGASQRSASLPAATDGGVSLPSEALSALSGLVQEEVAVSPAQHLRLVLEARETLARHLSSLLLAMATQPGASAHDWRSVGPQVGLLVQAARAEVRQAPSLLSLQQQQQQQQGGAAALAPSVQLLSHTAGVAFALPADGEPSGGAALLVGHLAEPSPHAQALGPAAPPAGMLELALRVLSTCSAASGALNGGDAAGALVAATPAHAGAQHGARSPRLSEAVVQPLLRLLTSLAKESQQQLLLTVAAHLLRAQLAAWAQAAARHQAQHAQHEQEHLAAAAMAAAAAQQQTPDGKAQPRSASASPGPASSDAAEASAGSAAGLTSKLSGAGSGGAAGASPPGALSTRRSKGQGYAALALPGADAAAAATQALSKPWPMQPGASPANAAPGRAGSGAPPAAGGAGTARGASARGGAVHLKQPALPFTKAPTGGGAGVSESAGGSDSPRPASLPSLPPPPPPPPPRPTLEECLAQAPGLLLGIVGTYMLDPHSGTTRALALQLYASLHAGKAAAAGQGKQQGAAAAGGSRSAAFARGGGAGGAAGSSGRSGLSSLLASGASGGAAGSGGGGGSSSSASGRGWSSSQQRGGGRSGAGGEGAAGSGAQQQQRSVQSVLALLEDLVEWLPAACAAGHAGEDLLRLVQQVRPRASSSPCHTPVVLLHARQRRIADSSTSLRTPSPERVRAPSQDCVGATASAGAYPLLAKLLASIMALIPRLVATLLAAEAPASMPSPNGVALDPAGVSLVVQQLVALLARLVEYSELQGHLLNSPAQLPGGSAGAGVGGAAGAAQGGAGTPQLALLLWTYAGLQVR